MSVGTQGAVDLSESLLPLRLLRVRQLQAKVTEPLLFSTFSADLEQPTLSPSERSTSIERLLHARRRTRESSFAEEPGA